MHNLEVAEVEKKLETSIESGLSFAEAERRLKENGKNEIKDRGKIPGWLLFLRQFICMNTQKIIL